MCSRICIQCGSWNGGARGAMQPGVQASATEALGPRRYFGAAGMEWGQGYSGHSTLLPTRITHWKSTDTGIHALNGFYYYLYMAVDLQNGFNKDGRLVVRAVVSMWAAVHVNKTISQGARPALSSWGNLPAPTVR